MLTLLCIFCVFMHTSDVVQDEHLIPLHVLVGVSQGERGHVLLSPNHANADPQDAFILSSFGWS